MGLTVAKYLLIENIDLQCDSQLVAVQLRGEYEAKNERMEQYLQIAKPLLASFKRIEVTHVPKTEHQMADVLANLETNALHPVQDQDKRRGSIVHSGHNSHGHRSAGRHVLDDAHHRVSIAWNSA